MTRDAHPGRRPTRAARLHVALRAASWLIIGALLVYGAWVTRFGTRWPSVYVMSGDSMAPTLYAGQHFLAWGPPSDLRPGDLIVFRFEDEDEVFHVLRRLAALPGDTVGMDSGRVLLNGEPQSWPFRILRPAASRSELAIEGTLYDWGPWVVPTDSVVVLADTRDMLGWPDSRFIGFVPRDDILARATRRLNGRPLRSSP